MKSAICILLLLILPQQEWKNYDSEHFSMKYPADWNPIENNFIEGNYTWNSPINGKTDKFSESVNLLIQDLRGLKIDLDDYTEFVTGQIISIEGAILKSKRMKGNDGMEYQVVHYTAIRSGLPLYFVQHYRLYEEQAYVLTFTAEQKKYADYEKIAAEILNSFKIKWTKS